MPTRNSDMQNRATEFYRASMLSFADIMTPALVVDEVALQRNIAFMADFARKSGKTLRPHVKSHKCIEIARLQIAAGAGGIACATIGEAEAMAAAGIADILITSPLASPEKCFHAADLARRVNLCVTVDHPHHVALLDQSIAQLDSKISILIDLDVGQRRGGVTSVAQAVDLARLVHNSARMRFRGLQGFAGQAQHIIQWSDRQHAAAAVDTMLKATRGALEQTGFPCDAISGSGTGTASFDVMGAYTELQVGSYVFMDSDYGALEDRTGAKLPFITSLYVLATVTSSNIDGQVTVDAGTKALAVNGPAPKCILGVPDGSSYRFAGDEHGIISFASAASSPRIGSKILIETTHCDPTINLHASYCTISASGKVSEWVIVGRYK